MKKIKYYFIPVLLIIAFVIIMTTGNIVKKPFSQKDDVQYYIERVNKDVNSEKWVEGKLNVDKLKIAWRKVSKRVQFSVERDEMVAIDRNIAKIKGSIEAKDKTSALIELSEIKENWMDLEE